MGNGTPQRRGLYDPRMEHDACGIGFVVNISGEKSHRIVEQGIEMLKNLEHRGACGCDPTTGDGAGVLLQVPHEFFHKVLPDTIPFPGQYGVGMVFLPPDRSDRHVCEDMLNRAISEEGQRLLGWRDVPVEPKHCGEMAREAMPVIRQVFVGRGPGAEDEDALERKLYIIRKKVERENRETDLKQKSLFYIASLSSRTIVYKGQLTAPQIPKFYLDLNDSTVQSAMAMVHSRFSTNTMPSWKRAHPYRFIIHNGEINTLRGNINWMHAREKILASPLFGENVRKLLPIIDPDTSDSGMFDNVLELLFRTGRSLPHSILMMIPEAWQNDLLMVDKKRAMYEYHSCLMEPWDGPAAICFTDGRLIGAVLDRNGLRPARHVVTKDGLVVLASEVGVLDIPPENILSKGRLQPGRMFLVDTIQKRIISDEEIKNEIGSRKPYREWLTEKMVRMDQLPPPRDLPERPADDELLRIQRTFGYTAEDLKMLMSPMALNGEEAVGSMGIDVPLAVLSNRPQLLFNYFKQLFAQVTNPPVDPLREEMVMSIETALGSERNLFEETPEHSHQVNLKSPSLSDAQMAQLKEIEIGEITSRVLPILFQKSEGTRGMESALADLSDSAASAVADGVHILILSDRGTDAQTAPIPSLLAVGAVHHHLIREGTRTRCGIVIETGEAREVMHFALLMGYGAAAWCPYAAHETIRNMVRQGILKNLDEETALEHYRKAIDKGVLKIATKMGISTLQSYHGAQIFEAVGLNRSVVDRYFKWTPSRIEGVGLDVLTEEVLSRHRFAHEVDPEITGGLEAGGVYQWRRRGEQHLLDPDTIAKLQHAVRANNPKSYKEYTDLINNQSTRLMTLRGLLQFKPGNPIPISEVEPAKEIVKRFATGAMSLGSISRETHETLAIAMNRIGGKSNTGEGGEDPERFVPDANGDTRRSAVKQVASARFGVTINYLVNCDDLQIKIAQGAKPGEGGQLPGHKVDAYIAKIRYSVPGVGLISPPPHHDIYSIEDIAQLIYDLKNANPKARVHVKLVSEFGVGTIAAGVAKAKADVVLISGFEGGTGASPLTSIQHAGLPWELGLAETQQVLVANGLRGRIVVQTDGKILTGRDVVIAAMLGADEFGFSTGPLISLGCIMMRVCHLNTCPVGIATQDPVLRKMFAGKPEDVINYCFFVAEEVREIMAGLGIKTLNDLIGRVDLLDTRNAVDHWKAKGVNLSTILYKPEPTNRWYAIRHSEYQDHDLGKALDNKLIELAHEAIERKKPCNITLPIRNFNRCVGTMMSGEIAKRHGEAGLPDDTIRFHFIGSAGQSFGAFLAGGVTLSLEGDANDYAGKGLSGGRIIIRPPADVTYKAEENILIGNVALYGATSGEAFFRGVAGERFAVRNSGAAAVVEGVGDHGCEYMTHGTVVVLGRTGRNFASGMSGGVAYVLDDEKMFKLRCNHTMVELLPVESEIDFADLNRLIRRHVDYTNSAIGRKILERWDDFKPLFKKVLPLEYKRVLQKKHLNEEAQKLAAV